MKSNIWWILPGFSAECINILYIFPTQVKITYHFNQFYILNPYVDILLDVMLMVDEKQFPVQFQHEWLWTEAPGNFAWQFKPILFNSVHIINSWISLLKTSYILLMINVSCITKSLKSVLLNQINGLSLMDMTELLWFHHSVPAPNKSQEICVYFLNVALMLQRVL